MARRPPTQKADKHLTPDEMRRAADRLTARTVDLRNLDVNTISEGDDPAVENLAAKIRSTLASIYGENSAQFDRLQGVCVLDETTYTMNYFGAGPSTTVQEIREGVDRGRNRAIAILEAEIETLREVAGDSPATNTTAAASTTPSDRVFVVHGRDDGAKNEVARFIEKLGLRPVILHEQASHGKTIIEKFEHYGGNASFAVVIMTPDDKGGPADAEVLNPRARQNVIGELFWFAGRLGRERVCALKKGNIEIPTDIAGVVYTDMDSAGAWKNTLIRELEAAGYAVKWEALR